jgi:hypothetical protein
MEFLSELWMPALISAAIVWFASAIMHMVLPHHKGEWKGLPNEEAVLAALKGVAPGQYTFPHCKDMSEMKDPAFMEKMKNNPNGTITIWAGQVNMGRNLLLTFLTYVVIGVFVAYVGWHAMKGEQVEYMDVFRLAGAAAFMAHGLGMLTHMVWFQVKGFWTYLFDNLVFALLTAGVFAWLWPK